MDSSLKAFLISTPERAVPYPWERRVDLMTNMMFYKNNLTNTVVTDVRSRVNLGGGLYYESDLWSDMTGCSSIEHSHYCHINRMYDHDHPFVIQASCCYGPFLFLIVPEPIWFCPVCAHLFPIYC